MFFADSESKVTRMTLGRPRPAFFGECYRSWRNASAGRSLVERKAGYRELKSPRSSEMPIEIRTMRGTPETDAHTQTPAGCTN